ncbi:PEP-CTERM sorting domain-containing protein [Scytonema sp. UIC 10036]|uniref:LEVG family PEP-CTERM protein n=1 Tax=Scytonema sp. UIC 10036 TaxID=2304196 RepID=UPI0012DA2EE0|nr:LEVG family PEP-CTERM protein [Scytonema sp. UIC 10036]MUG97048.1 PEP-CTERM sorting domain-containing protein [Scytonema sp. UIC 10036]
MQKFNLRAAIVLGTTLSIGIAANMPAAHAISLVPNQEGEIKLTNFGCVVNPSDCIDTSSLGFTVTSLDYGSEYGLPQYGLSRLFVDMNGTANNWASGISFAKTDAGTNPSAYQLWLRPVAIKKDSSVPENGQLEIGRYEFTFDRAYEDLELSFLDVETSGFSGILSVNGQPPTQLLPAKGNNKIQTLKLNNVKSFIVQLGIAGSQSKIQPGDGVRLAGIATKPVPEPGTTLSLGVLAFVGLFGLRKRDRASKTRTS